MEIEPRPVGSVAQPSTLHSTGVQGITETTESLGRSNVFFAFFGCYTPPCGQCGATIQSLEAKIDCLELNGGGNGCAFPSMRRPKSRICSSIQRISASSSAGRAAQAGASIRHRKMLSLIFDQGPNSFNKKDTNCCVQTHQQDPHEAKL